MLGGWRGTSLKDQIKERDGMLHVVAGRKASASSSSSSRGRERERVREH